MEKTCDKCGMTYSDVFDECPVCSMPDSSIEVEEFAVDSFDMGAETIEDMEEDVKRKEELLEKLLAGKTRSSTRIIREIAKKPKEEEWVIEDKPVRKPAKLKKKSIFSMPSIEKLGRELPAMMTIFFVLSLMLSAGAFDGILTSYTVPGEPDINDWENPVVSDIDISLMFVTYDGYYINDTIVDVHVLDGIKEGFWYRVTTSNGILTILGIGQQGCSYNVQILQDEVGLLDLGDFKIPSDWNSDITFTEVFHVDI